MNSPRRARPLAGGALVVTGLTHIALGVVAWTQSGPADFTLSFWFTMFGVVGATLGIATAGLERERGYVPLPVTSGVFAIMLFGLLATGVMSGFIALLVPVGIGLVGWLRRSG